VFGYLLHTAWRSLKRNPFLSLLVVVGIGLGIGVSTTFVTAVYRLQLHPIPEKEGQLFYVRMDSWDPDRAWDDDRPDDPPSQMTWRDALAVTSGDIPTHQTFMYKAQLTVHPEDKDMRAFRSSARVCTNDFFNLFEVPFQYGAPWSDAADAAADQVVVLDHATNSKLFGGEDSVGETLRIQNRDFTVAGVMAPWKPTPKYYDTHNNPFGDPEGLFIPIMLSEALEINGTGNDSNWKGYDGEEYADALASEKIWIQTWVQLDTPQQREQYAAFLDAYALDQRKMGRFERPLNNWTQETAAWLEYEQMVPQEAKTLLIISLLFLVVCSVNLIGILLGKFLARAPEIGVRRALGASRGAIFMQHLLECELIAVVGGIAGLGLSVLGLWIIEALFAVDLNFKLDLNMVGAGMLLALVAGLLAGAYPAWRVCRIPPAQYLKAQ
jgi:putative ABC transport system permease protein